MNTLKIMRIAAVVSSITAITTAAIVSTNWVDFPTWTLLIDFPLFLSMWMFFSERHKEEQGKKSTVNFWVWSLIILSVMTVFISVAVSVIYPLYIFNIVSMIIAFVAIRGRKFVNYVM